MLVRFLLLTFAALACAAQSTSDFARPGLIHYVEGRVLFAGQPISPKAGEFFRMDPGDILATEAGRAEVLLTPGVFLRLAENSSFRLVSDTVCEILSGTAMVELGETPKDASITLRLGRGEAALTKRGLYRAEVLPPSLRIYDGDARITGTVEVQKNRDLKDEFYLWNAHRALYIDKANVSSALEAHAVRGFQTSWVWNPWYGLYTFVPRTGFGYSPFDWPIYSPESIHTIAPPPPEGFAIHLP